MTDDYPNDITTTGVISVDMDASGLFEVVDDADWFRFTADKYIMHRFLATGFTGTAYRVMDDAGNELQMLLPTSNNFLAPYSGTFYLEALQRFSATDYTIQMLAKEDDHTNFFSQDPQPLLLNNFNFAGGIIEVEGDQDILKMQVAKNANYQVNVHGSDSSDGTLENPIARVYRAVGPFGNKMLELVVADNNGGPGRSSQVEFQAADNEQLFLMVDAVSGTGSYRIVWNVVDDYPGDRTTDGILTYVLNWDTGEKVFGNLETADDVDAFIINAKAGNWYNVEAPLNANPRITIFDPANQIVNDPPVNSDSSTLFRQGVFYAATAGEYLVRVEGHGNISGTGRLNLGPYELRVDARQPFIEPVDEMLNRTNDYVSFDTEFEFDKYEVFSEIHLQQYATEFGPLETLHPPRRIIELPIDSSKQLRVPNGYNGSADIWVRAHEPITSQWTSWRKVQATGQPINYFSNFHQRLHYGTFAFATALPDYFAGDPMIDGFEPFTAAEQQAFRDALYAWNIRERANPDNTFTEIAPGLNNDAAEVMLFKTNLTSQDVYVIPNNWDFRDPSKKLADFIIDTDSTVMSDLTPGNQGFFEMLRGVGVMTGMPENPESRGVSIMGNRADYDFQPSTIWPSTPLPADFHRATPFEDEFEFDHGEPEDFEIFTLNDGPDIYQLRDNVLGYSAIMDAGGLDKVSASAVDVATTIDLRPGMSSFRGGGQNQHQTFMITFDTVIEDATGGNRSDIINGNRFDNVILGGNGNDTITPGAGYDYVYGGRDGDTYVFEPGDGTNIINEQRLDGFDRVQYIGFDTVDQLEDFTFQRLGNDLLVRLRMDDSDGHIDDAIRIRNMNDPLSRVEQMRLDNIFGQNLVNVSLPSVYSQAIEQPRRFELAGGNDQFGPLANPV